MLSRTGFDRLISVGRANRTVSCFGIVCRVWHLGVHAIPVHALHDVAVRFRAKVAFEDCPMGFRIFVRPIDPVIEAPM